MKENIFILKKNMLFHFVLLYIYIYIYIYIYSGIKKNMDFPGNPDGKESLCNARDAGDPGSIPGLGRSPGEWNGYPFQYSGLEDSTDCIIHGTAKSQTRLSNFH